MANITQRCPKCGAWCEGVENLDKFHKGSQDFINFGENLGEKIGGVLGETGKKWGGKIGRLTGEIGNLSKLPQVKEMVFGDNYLFKCNKCQHEWGTDKIDEKMASEYEMRYEKIKQEKIQAINCYFDSWRNVNIDEGRREVIKKIEKEIEIAKEDKEYTTTLNEIAALMSFCINDNQRAIQFMVSNINANPNNKRFSALKDLFYKDLEKIESNYLEYYEILKLIERIYEEDDKSKNLDIIKPKYKFYLEKYISNFTSIDPSKRKYIYLQDKIGTFPDTIKVLPLAHQLPGIKFIGEGHPRDNQLYVRHPLKADYYLPFESYEFELFRDQLDEFTFIMGNIGAKKISYSIINNKDSEFKKHRDIGVEAGVKDTSYGGSGKYEQEKDSSWMQNLKQKYEANASYFPETTIQIPDITQLTWYPHNENWQRKVQLRMAGKKRTDSFVISMSNENKVSDTEKHQLELDINYLTLSANVKANYSSKISKHTQKLYEWRMDVEFYPLNKSIFRRLLDIFRKIFISDQK